MTGRAPAGRVTWLGHSTVLLDLDGARVLTDPVLRRRVLHLVRRNDVPPPDRIDAVLVSHLHHDHLDLPSLASLGLDVPVVLPTGGGRLVRGFERVTEVEPGAVVRVGPLEIDVVEAHHDGRRARLGPPVPALGFLVRGSRSVYFAGDTDLFDRMASLGPLDLALLPISGWGPTLGPGHLGPDTAAHALTLLRPRAAVPIHWGTYRVAGLRDPGRRPAEEFALAAAREAPGVDVRILGLQGTLELP